MAVRDVMCTSNPIHEYEFSWTIDNFSLTAQDVIRGPVISPIPGYLENACLELKYEYDCNAIVDQRTSHGIRIFFINLNPKEYSAGHRNISSKSSLGNINNDILTKAIPFTRFYGRIELISFENYYNNGSYSKLRLAEEMNLLQDKLVVKGKLLFCNYAIVSSALSQTIKRNSEAIGDLSKDLKSMYISGSSTDVTLSVGESLFQSHKVILCSRSPVFAKMFDQNMLERNTNKVVIKDTDAHAFNCFLLFLYTGVVEDKNWDIVLSLYSLAHKYEVGSLHKSCWELLRNGITVDSVCSVLVLSDLHADKDLKDACKAFIRVNLVQIVGRPEWGEIVTAKSHLAKEVLDAMGKAS